MKILKYLAARLREPSTLAGLSVIGVMVGLPPGTVDLAAQVVTGAVAIAAALIPDAK